ncbi:MAG: TRAP transporter small permease [Alphaproteobacteria bacterium]|nr:TRAP transporter small permease [Alphaproteobacteria bacterium]
MSEGTPLARAARRVETLLALVSRAAAGIAGIACLATLAMICYAVAMRYFLSRPQGWTDEAVGWLVVVAVMFAVPEAQRRAEHIGVDALIDKASARWRRILLGFGVFSVALTALILIREGWEMVAFSRMIGLKAIGIPEVSLWSIQLFVPLGAVLLLLVSLGQLFCHAAGLEPQGPEPDALDVHE